MWFFHSTFLGLRDLFLMNLPVTLNQDQSQKPPGWCASQVGRHCRIVSRSIWEKQCIWMNFRHNLLFLKNQCIWFSHAESQPFLSWGQKRWRWLVTSWPSWSSSSFCGSARLDTTPSWDGWRNGWDPRRDLSLRKWWYNRNITWECHRHMIGIYYRMDFTQQGVLENLRYVLGKRFDLNVNQVWLSLILQDVCWFIRHLTLDTSTI